MKRIHKARLEAGMCRNCGVEPHEVGKQCCTRCNEILSHRTKERKHRLVLRGLCSACAVRPIDKSSFCSECYRTHLDHSAQSRLKLKDKVFLRYGGYLCACCGESERAFLSIDHIKNGGTQHRREIGMSRLYYWLRDNGYPEGFQVLCMNCQFGKKNNHGICPHQNKRDANATESFHARRSFDAQQNPG